MEIKNNALLVSPVSYTTTSGNNNNLDLKGTLIVVTTSNNNDTITGIIPFTNGHWIEIINISSNILILSNNDTNSTSGNRFLMVSGQNIYLQQNKKAGGFYHNGAFYLREYKENVFGEFTLSGAASIPNNTLTIISWNSTIKNIGMTHSDSTNPSRVTMPANGDYICNITLNFATWSKDGAITINILKNGVLYKNVYNSNLTVPLTSLTVETYANLTNWVAGDYLEVQILQDTGSARNLSTGSFLFVQKNA